MAGANCGPVLFGIVLSTLANPENIPPTVEVQRGAETDHLFDERVYERVPAVLLTLAIACGVLSVIGGFMVIDKSEEEQ